jgi:quercetin dioxygenase-like cupin family protein
MGDTSKPGPYVMLLKWWPNNFSQPHMHEFARYITVVSGTWWMSSSPTFDPTKTYPMPQGTVVVHEANKVHWDGAKNEPTVLMIAGMGPANSIRVDANGNPAPRAPAAAGGAAPRP